MMRIYKDLYIHVRRAVMAAWAISGAICLLLLAGPLFALHLLTRASVGAELESLPVLAAVLAMAIAGAVLLDFVRGVILARAAAWFDHVPGQLILEGGLKRALGTAPLAQQAAAIEQLRNFLAGANLVAVLNCLWSPLFLAGLFYIQPVIGAVVSSGWLLLAAAVLRRVRRQSLTAAQAPIIALAQRRIFADQLAGSARMVRALGVAQGAANAWENINRGYIGGFYQSAKSAASLHSLARAVFYFSEGSVLAVGVVAVAQGQMTFASLVVAMMLALRAGLPWQRLAASGEELIETRRAWRRLRDLALLPILPQSDIGADRRARGVLQLRNVSVAYPGRTTRALQRLDLDLAEGDSLIIAGAAGCGKTTLAAVIAGALGACEGSVTLDGISLDRWQSADCAPPISFAGDEPMILSGSVQQNILRFRDNCLMSAAHAAMKIDAHQLLSELPCGYEFDVGRAGAALSLREKRAVALARAVHANPSILVLDAPETGLLDAEVRQLATALRRLRDDGMSLVIATNDPQLQALGNRAVVLSEGMIEAAGSPDELFTAASNPPFPVEPWHNPAARLATFKEEANEG